MVSYESILRRCSGLQRAGARLGFIGSSLYGNPIPALRVGTGAAVIITAAIHGRESIGAEVVLSQAEYALRFGVPGCVWFLPVLNPDGLLLNEFGLNLFARHQYAHLAQFRSRLVEFCGADYDYRLYKANGRGVDLNVNFDARWGEGAQNVFAHATENYVGVSPFSEPETQALKAFTLSVRPLATVSYHAKGQELYWYFHQDGDRLDRDKSIAERLNAGLGYRLGGAATNSAGGYKDWCIAALGIPAFTVELVDDRHAHPLPDTALSSGELTANLTLPHTLLRLNNEKEMNKCKRKPTKST